MPDSGTERWVHPSVILVATDLSLSLIHIYAHDGARHYAEELFHRGPALHGADGYVDLLHPAIDDRTQLGHLQQSRVGDAGGADVSLDGGKLGLGSICLLYTSRCV